MGWFPSVRVSIGLYNHKEQWQDVLQALKPWRCRVRDSGHYYTEHRRPETIMSATKREHQVRANEVAQRACQRVEACEQLVRAPVETREHVVINRSKMTVMAILAMFAISIVASAAARAAEGPSITIEPKTGETKRLGANETRTITVKAFSTFELEDTTNVYKVKCTTLKNQAGAFYVAGAAAGNDPTSSEILEFSNCTGTENGKTCTIGIITTKPLVNEGVESTDKTTGLTLFKPASGKIFAEYTETGCVTPVKVEGEKVAEGYFDENGTKGVAITLTTAKLPKVSWILKTLKTPPAKVIKFSGGTGTETAVKPFEVLATPATLQGEALIQLVSLSGVR